MGASQSNQFSGVERGCNMNERFQRLWEYDNEGCTDELLIGVSNPRACLPRVQIKIMHPRYHNVEYINKALA